MNKINFCRYYRMCDLCKYDLVDCNYFYKYCNKRNDTIDKIIDKTKIVPEDINRYLDRKWIKEQINKK